MTSFVSPLLRHEMVYNFLIVRFFMFFFSVKMLKEQVHGSAHAHLQKMLFFCRDMLYRLCKQYVKNQSAHSPGSHLYLINSNICK